MRARPAPLATMWALSDPVRVDIVDRVAAGSAVTVTQLAAELPITRQAVARHTRTLEEAGVLVAAQDGRERRYRVDMAPLDGASRWLAQRARGWEDALTRLAAYVEER